MITPEKKLTYFVNLKKNQMKKYFIYLVLLFSLTSSAFSSGWIEDNVAAAKNQKKLIFADYWAIWCYSCMVMKENVLPDLEEKGALDKFVKLSINTDNPKNKKLIEKANLKFWPTFIIYDEKLNEQRRLEGENTFNTMKLFLEDKLKNSDYKKLADKIESLKNTNECYKVINDLKSSNLYGCQKLYLYDTILDCLKDDKKDVANEIDDFSEKFLKEKVLSKEPECNDYYQSFYSPIKVAQFQKNDAKAKERSERAISFFKVKSGFNTGKINNRGFAYILRYFLMDDKTKASDLEKLLNLAATKYKEDYYFANALASFYREKKDFKKAAEWISIAKQRTKDNLVYIQMEEIKILIEQNKKDEAKNLLKALLKKYESGRIKIKLENLQKEYFK